ncbi:MAG: metal-dependent hydrolase, partial [Bacteroidota bacterium]
MTAPAHISFGWLVYLVLLTPAGVRLSLLNGLVITAASLLPDLDTEASGIGRTLPFLSRFLEHRWGHRTLTHSLPFMGLLALVLSPLLAHEGDLYACIMAGYASHPFLDSMTVNGVRMFYPFSPLRCVFPLEVNNPHRYRVRSGSGMDRTLTVLFLLAC